MRPSPLRLLDYREFPVLYVDDEPDNLRIFELTFREDFKILTATSAEEGLGILNDNPIAVVLSDQRMPGMSGVDFLARVRAIDPQTIRMLVTAYGDAETLGIAINDGSIYRYIPKPWDPDDLRLTLRRAMEAHALDRERDALIRELTQLNEFSRNLHRELDVQRTIDLLLREIQGEFGFDGAALLLFEDAGATLRWAGAEPRGAVATEFQKLAINRSNAREFVEGLWHGSSRVLRLACLEDLPRTLREWLTEVSADEILVVPLRGTNCVLGALAVDNRSGGRCFGAADQTLLDGVATQAVVAIETARIVEALRTEQCQTRPADRLGTLSGVATQLAREINNPLVCIQTFVDLAPGKCDTPDDTEFWQTYHQLARSELDRISGLLSMLTGLGEGGALRGAASAEISLPALIEEAAGVLQVDLRDSGVQLVRECDSTTPAVFGLQAQLQQVIRTLLSNAIAATPAGGEVAIRVAPDPCSEREMVSLSVTDGGEGIAEEELERIFDPFSAGEEPGPGSGLALVMTHQIVEDHEGTIEVSSRAGQGTCFVVRLPVKRLSGPPTTPVA